MTDNMLKMTIDPNLVGSVLLKVSMLILRVIISNFVISGNG